MSKIVRLWLLLVTMAWAAEPVKEAAHRAAKNGQPAVVRSVPHATASLDARLQQAFQAYQAGEHVLAEGLYQQVLAQVPRNVDALLGLAAIAQQGGENALAMQYYQRALVIEPENALAHAALSDFMATEEVESHLKRWLQRQQDSPSLHLALGNYYARQLRWGEAQQAYFSAYRLHPRHVLVSFNLAVSLEQLGQKSQALMFYQRALSLMDKAPDVLPRVQLEQHIQSLQR